MIAITRTIIMGSTIICRAFHTALRQLKPQILIEFCTLVIGLGLIPGVAQCEYTFIDIIKASLFLRCPFIFVSDVQILDTTLCHFLSHIFWVKIVKIQTE